MCKWRNRLYLNLLGKKKSGFESGGRSLIPVKAANVKDLRSPSMTVSINEAHENDIHFSRTWECDCSRFPRKAIIAVSLKSAR